jgi:curved DNA-binding protein CbpA
MRHDRPPADCYGILGPTSTATLAHVEKAHRKLARQPHPLIKTRDHQNIAGGKTLCRRCTAAR